MELFIVVRVQTEKSAEDIANEVRANLEYEGVEVVSIAASASLGDAVVQGLELEAK